MNLRGKFEKYKGALKWVFLMGSGATFTAYQFKRTIKVVNRVVNSNVLNTEKSHIPEYIYIDDPAYDLALKMEEDKQIKTSFWSTMNISNLWKSLQYSLTWKLLWLCRNGNKEQQNIALEQLAAFKSNKPWDCIKIAQALDQNTAVLLARTKGVDLRYFLPPPLHVRKAALGPELMSFSFLDMLSAVQSINPHTCIQQFLYKYLVNIQDSIMEADTIPSKPDNVSEPELCILCLDAIHHHISLFASKIYEEDVSVITLVKLGLFPKLAELLHRNTKNTEIDWAVIRILTVLSVHTQLLSEFFQNGLIGHLARLIKSKDIRLASSAAVCLANISGEECYRPGLFLLHPIYRARKSPACETLLVHGLRGGVFVTWRQRDRGCRTIGIIDVTISNTDGHACEDNKETNYLDPELKQVIEDLDEMDEESLLSEYDVILHDLPINSKRELKQIISDFSSTKKRNTLKNENEDNCTYTHCWPKDWLPKDCKDLRIVGVNYWSSLSEWLEKCPWQAADIEMRAKQLAPDLIDAGIGTKNIPVVWLAHSMGGLIVKQVLIEAAKNENEVMVNLCKNTKALLFFSTPHRGSALATMPRAAAAVLWPSSDVRQLQENSPTLLQLHKEFLENADRFEWETISFAETMPTLITAFKVPVHFVEASSADLGRGVFYQLPLDHLAICKPATRESLLYATVVNVVQRVTLRNQELSLQNKIILWALTLWWSMTQSKLGESLEETKLIKKFDYSLLQTFSDF